MFKNADSEGSAIFGANSHLFLPVVVLSIVEIFLSHYYISSPFSFQFGYSTLFSILLLGSVPFSVIDPPIWFSVFMTTFIHMLFYKGFLYFSLLSSIVFFVCLTIHKTSQKRNERIIPIDV